MQTETFPAMMQPMTWTQQLVTEIRSFIGRTGYTATQVGKEFANDGSFVNDILAGRKSPKLRRADELRAWMKSNEAPKRGKVER